MKEYPKIQTVWMRDERGKIREGAFSMPEFEYLANAQWAATEKVDGTNIRVKWDGQRVEFSGRTDAAQIPVPLVSRLRELFPEDGEKFRRQFGECGEVCLYGEGCGRGIQKAGAGYNPDGVDFILFDVLVGPWWLERHDVANVAAGMGCEVVPVKMTGTLHEICLAARVGVTSSWGHFIAEGLVMQPVVPLQTRKGVRIIAKIKTRDYQ